MWSQELAIVVWVRGVPRNGIELVVAHDCLSAAGIDHATDGHDAFQLPWSPVDEVSDKDRGAIFMTVGAAPIRIAKFGQQTMKFVCLPMYVSNDVICHGALPFYLVA